MDSPRNVFLSLLRKFIFDLTSIEKKTERSGVLLMDLNPDFIFYWFGYLGQVL